MSRWENISCPLPSFLARTQEPIIEAEEPLSAQSIGLAQSLSLFPQLHITEKIVQTYQSTLSTTHHHLHTYKLIIALIHINLDETHAPHEGIDSTITAPVDAFQPSLMLVLRARNCTICTVLRQCTRDSTTTSPVC